MEGEVVVRHPDAVILHTQSESECRHFWPTPAEKKCDLSPTCENVHLGCLLGSCQLCFTCSLTAQDLHPQGPGKGPLVLKVVLVLPLAFAVSLTVISSDTISSLLCSAIACSLSVRLEARLLCDRELSGFLCFSQVISRRTSCFRFCISACCCRPGTRIISPISH